MKDKLLQAMRVFLPVTLAFTVTFILLRFYEYVVAGGRLEVSAAMIAAATWYDFIFALVVTLPLWVLGFLLWLASHRVAAIMLMVAYGALLTIAYGCTSFFVITLVPLSADLFGYSWNDVTATIGSSGGWRAATMLPLLLTLALFVITWYLVRKKGWVEKLSPAVLGGVGAIMLLAWLLPRHPQPEVYESDLQYYAVVNKTEYFLTRGMHYWSDLRTSRASMPLLKGTYPFLHKAGYDTTVASLFHKADAYPNLVFILVEGLGRDFAGPNARYGGFTPFIDSLARHSLYWENALSNAGRTFGVLPSILGSLPYGRSGFMSYGTKMPEHQTLISLLKPYGYKANFFYGGMPGFDDMDVFLEYQGMDHMLSKTNFPSTYHEMSADAEGFSWGYADRDVLMHSLLMLESAPPTTPRIDIYLTLSTHEPFVAPEKKFNDAARRRAATLTDVQKKVYTENAGVFSCLLYTDDALREFMKAYARRPDYKHTIFIITGDHRLIPVPQASKISRFHVPIIIYSPLLKAPRKIPALTTHSNVPATLLSLLHTTYQLDFPQSLSFISGPAAWSETFSSNLDIALMRNKNELVDYVLGDHFLSEGRLYRIVPGLDLEPVVDAPVRQRLVDSLARFKQHGEYACETNHLDKTDHHHAGFTLSDSEQQYLDSVAAESLSPDSRFALARTLAFNGKRKQSRVVIRHLLNSRPNYLDGWILLGRTWAWDGQYDTARYFLEQARRRSPDYYDIYCAQADIAY